MRRYFLNIFEAVWTAMVGLQITFREIFDRAVTHHYPYNDKRFPLDRNFLLNEQKVKTKWGPHRTVSNIRKIHDGFRGRLDNRVEDCIGCMSCARVCPVSCITLETERAGRGEDLGETRNVVHLKDGTIIIGAVEGEEKLSPETTVTIQDLEGQTHTYPSDQVESIIARRSKRMRIVQYDIDLSLCMFCGLCTESCPTECLTMTQKFNYPTYDLRDLIYHFVEPIEATPTPEEN
jgi:formate hydrogenlyase subunit 6/NADH:ubiquinone oxidoreductase subunit I